MEVIAITKDGALIQASTHEVFAILKASVGQAPNELRIGQKIPAIDYASTINNIKTLKDDYKYIKLKNSVDEFYDNFKKLSDSVDDAGSINVEA